MNPRKREFANGLMIERSERLRIKGAKVDADYSKPTSLFALFSIALTAMLPGLAQADTKASDIAADIMDGVADKEAVVLPIGGGTGGAGRDGHPIRRRPPVVRPIRPGPVDHRLNDALRLAVQLDQDTTELHRIARRFYSGGADEALALRNIQALEREVPLFKGQVQAALRARESLEDTAQDFEYLREAFRSVRLTIDALAIHQPVLVKFDVTRFVFQDLRQLYYGVDFGFNVQRATSLLELTVRSSLLLHRRVSAEEGNGSGASEVFRVIAQDARSIHSEVLSLQHRPELARSRTRADVLRLERLVDQARRLVVGLSPMVQREAQHLVLILEELKDEYIER